VSAGDDFTGKKIICGYIDNKSKETKMSGWEFISKNKVIEYPEETRYSYQETPTEIFVRAGLLSPITVVQINKDKLEVTLFIEVCQDSNCDVREVPVLYKEGQCKFSTNTDMQNALLEFEINLKINK
jgi:hypothetical protein